MKLKETRGSKLKFDFSDFNVGETLTYTAKDKDLKDGVATYEFANKINSRILAYSRRNDLNWKIARRTFGAEVEITRLA